MTRDDMLDCLRYNLEDLKLARGSDYSGVEAIEMAIKILEAQPEIVYTSIYECGSDVVCFRILGVFSSIETATKAIERDLEIEGDYITNYAKETREWEIRYTNGVATYRIEKRVVDSFDN